MLQGLDDVPWAALEHAYGPAGDVPDLVRQLLDPDPERAIQAYQHAASINPSVAHRINPTWRLADLLKEKGLN